MKPLANPDASPPLVLCLCAAWCRTCDAYLPVMQALAAQHPGWRFGWLDVEDHADVLAAGGAEAALDIETFPTVLLVWQGQARFLGPLAPQAGVLTRLLLQASELPPLVDTAAQALARNATAIAAQGLAALP
ncbi:thioredoxin family protein [Ideonella azotifigens]|uniref:Thioredoxin n=1 Tax=Ideonella azotifigens TaxID=513160 RepID=A0ABN1JMV2_9BURK|nr:thioredoxin family protein [Ideonella azotifigens]MCD2339879.1 thioredoxin family protein [Ideonella azotifigens]